MLPTPMHTLLWPALQKWELKGHKESVLGVAFSRAADSLLSCAGDGSVLVWS